MVNSHTLPALALSHTYEPEQIHFISITLKKSLVEEGMESDYISFPLKLSKQRKVSLFLSDRLIIETYRGREKFSSPITFVLAIANVDRQILKSLLHNPIVGRTTKLKKNGFKQRLEFLEAFFMSRECLISSLMISSRVLSGWKKTERKQKK